MDADDEGRDGKAADSEVGSLETGAGGGGGAEAEAALGAARHEAASPAHPPPTALRVGGLSHLAARAGLGAMTKKEFARRHTLARLQDRRIHQQDVELQDLNTRLRERELTIRSLTSQIKKLMKKVR